MNQQTPTDNDFLFRAGRHRQANATATTESAWLNAPREGFTAQQDAKRQKLSDSKEGRTVNGYFIVGHIKAKG